MPQCQHHEICGQDVEGDPAEGLCIFHFTNPFKDKHAFAKALTIYREHEGNNFSQFVLKSINK